MPAPISLDLRTRIVRAAEQGSSIRAAARRFDVSPSAAIKFMQRLRRTGSVAAARYGGHRRPILEPHAADLHELVTAVPDATLAELQATLVQRFGVSVALSTLHAALRRIGLRHKKSAESRRAGSRRCGRRPPALASRWP